MNYYETTFICAPNMTPDKVTGFIDRITSTIKQNKGEITSLNEWGKRRMAYSINKYNEGIYVNIEFKAETGEIISKIEHIYKLAENVLRYLTIRAKKKKFESSPELDKSKTETKDEATSQVAVAGLTENKEVVQQEK